MYKIYNDAAGEWRWRYVAANGNIISVSSEGYHNKSDCRRGIDIMKGSGNAPVTE
ncbi:YegP family protein [Pseudophaeobacter arcticus]|uniref:YegP family protein n=1 Tax=Pseudophaeobacter arcticus TaxID=385492 RepID=UPI002491B509|nr:DUF1508 domain-containing protein [Pseudophaeobacter arcticus]